MSVGLVSLLPILSLYRAGQSVQARSSANNDSVPVVQTVNEAYGRTELDSSGRARAFTGRPGLRLYGGADSGPSWAPYVSADGRYVTFTSRASNLVGGDTNGAADIFVRDRETEETTRVSVASSGSEANGLSSISSISTDGRYVAFGSYATNLVGGDANGCADIFVHDRQGATTARVSVAYGGEEGEGVSANSSISANGRYVAFESSASNLVSGDTKGTMDVFVYNRSTRRITWVSVTPDGGHADGESFDASLSADGRYVAFESRASNLVSGDTNGTMDIFVKPAFGDTTRVSVASGGGQANGHSWDPCISANSRYVAFSSDACNLVEGDTNGSVDIFVHERLSTETARVSIASDGTEANGGSGACAISGYGRFVAFSSYASNLVEGDTNGVMDVFVHDRETGETTRVSIPSDGS
jgi:Tol biopolymer transport system component